MKLHFAPALSLAPRCSRALGNAAQARNRSSAIPTGSRCPTPNSFPNDITAGADENLWFTAQSGDKIGITLTGRSTWSRVD
jgi:hypothetical protein